MKICCIANPNSSHTLRFIKTLAKKGHAIYLIGTRPLISPVPDCINYVTFPNYAYLRKISFPIRVILTRRALRKISPNIVHALGAAGSNWLARYSLFSPYCVTVMGSDINLLASKSLLYKRMTIESLKSANGIICVSNDLEKRMNYYNIDNKQIYILPFGIDTQIFKPFENKKILRDKLGIKHSSIVISIRAMQQIYNPNIIAKSIPSILETCPDTLFLIFVYNRDEEVLNDFRVEVTSSNSSRNVRYIDKIEDELLLARFYQAADVAISVPKSDGTPMSVLECMACGTPVVVSDLPSLHDWIIDNENGVFVPPGDVEAVSNSVRYLLKYRAKAEKMGDNASQTIHNWTDQENWVDQLMSIYDSIIHG